jgi:hypothetical protein
MNENEILESCLEALQRGASLASCVESYPELSDESLRVLQAAVRLQVAGQQLTPDPAFKRRARGNLMQRIAAEQRVAATPVVAPGPGSRLRQRWQAFWAGFASPGMHWQPLAAAMALVLFFALSMGVLAAAQKSQPGDLLYPVKQLTEQMHSVLEGDETTPPAAETPAPTASPSPTRIPPTATASITPETPAGGLPGDLPTTAPPTKPPVTPTRMPDTPVSPTATFTPPAPTMAPTMPPQPTRTPMPGPTMPPTMQPTAIPTMQPTMMPTTAPTMPATATPLPPTPTRPMPTTAPHGNDAAYDGAAHGDSRPYHGSHTVAAHTAFVAIDA